MRHGEYLLQIAPEFSTGGDRIKVAREWLGGGERSVLYTSAIWVQVPIAHEPPERAGGGAGLGIALPQGLLDAITAEIGPQSTSQEIKRLEEALAVERTRVDGLLGRALTPEQWAWTNRLQGRDPK